MHELSEEVQLAAPEDRWVKLGPEQGFAEGKVRSAESIDVYGISKHRAVDHLDVRAAFFFASLA
jgi:hypothetical protein